METAIIRSQAGGQSNILFPLLGVRQQTTHCRHSDTSAFDPKRVLTMFNDRETGCTIEVPRHFSAASISDDKRASCAATLFSQFKHGPEDAWLAFDGQPQNHE